MKKLISLFLILGMFFNCIICSSKEVSEEMLISHDKSLLQFEKIKKLHKKAYWAKDWDDEKIKKNIENSQFVYGLYENGIQTGYARVITDKSTFARILDEMVEEGNWECESYKMLIETIIQNPELKDCSIDMIVYPGTQKFHEEELNFVGRTDSRYMYLKRN